MAEARAKQKKIEKLVASSIKQMYLYDFISLPPRECDKL